MQTKLSTCDLCDQYKTDDSGAFRVLLPLYHNFGVIDRFAGRIATVKCHEDNTLVKAAAFTVAGCDRVIGSSPIAMASP